MFLWPSVGGPTPGETRVGNMLEKSKAADVPQDGGMYMGDPWPGLWTPFFVRQGAAWNFQDPRVHSVDTRPATSTQYAGNLLSGRVHSHLLHLARPRAMAAFRHRMSPFLKLGMDDPMKRAGGCLSVPYALTRLLLGRPWWGWLWKPDEESPGELSFLSGSAETAAGATWNMKPPIRPPMGLCRQSSPHPPAEPASRLHPGTDRQNCGTQRKKKEKNPSPQGPRIIASYDVRLQAHPSPPQYL